MFKNTMAVGPFDPARVCTTGGACEAANEREPARRDSGLGEALERVTVWANRLESCVVEDRSAMVGNEHEGSAIYP